MTIYELKLILHVIKSGKITGTFFSTEIIRISEKERQVRELLARIMKNGGRMAINEKDLFPAIWLQKYGKITVFLENRKKMAIVNDHD